MNTTPASRATGATPVFLWVSQGGWGALSGIAGAGGAGARPARGWALMSAGHARCGPRGGVGGDRGPRRLIREAAGDHRAVRREVGDGAWPGSPNSRELRAPLRTQAPARAPSRRRRRGHWPHAGFPRSPASRLHITRLDALFFSLRRWKTPAHSLLYFQTSHS